MSMKRWGQQYGWRYPGRGGLRWQDGNVRPFERGRTRVQPFKLGWLEPPAFAITDREPDA